MKLRILNLIILICVLLSPVIAQEIDLDTKNDVPMTFEQAYELMLNNNNALKATYEEVQEKTYKKRAALGAFSPKVALDASYAHLSDDIAITTTVPYLGSISTPIQNKNTFFVAGGAYWNLFTGGKIIALNSAARAKLEGTNEKYRIVKGDLTYELVKRYYGLRLARDVVQVRADVMNDIAMHLENAKKLEKAGIIAKSERLHAEVAFKQAEREYQAAKRDVEIVNSGLKALIKDKDADIDYVRVIPDSPLFTYKDKFNNYEYFKKEALEKSPLLAQMQVKKKLAKANFAGEVANYSPTVTAFAYDILGSKDLTNLVPRWSMGVSANFLVFDGLSRYNNVRAANSFKKQVDYEILDANNNIESLVNKQYQELLKYKEEYESTDASIESAKEALRTSKLAFSEGIGTSLSVVDAEVNQTVVRISRLNAVYNYDLALVDLLRTCGNSEEILEYMKNSEVQKFK